MIYASASTLAHRIGRREVSAEEVVRAHLRRIEQVNPRLNAVVLLGTDEALAAARRADAALARGEVAGPLHGVPFTVRDWIDAAGLPCTGGDPAFRERRPAEDATAVARMRRAGAILLGKTNVMIENEVYGRTNNPYRLAYSPWAAAAVKPPLSPPGDRHWAWDRTRAAASGSRSMPVASPD